MDEGRLNTEHELLSILVRLCILESTPQDYRRNISSIKGN